MKLQRLLKTKSPVVGYIGETGQSFRVNPTHSFLNQWQKLDILISDNPHLTIETIDILTTELKGCNQHSNKCNLKGNSRVNRTLTTE